MGVGGWRGRKQTFGLRFATSVLSLIFLRCSYSSWVRWSSEEGWVEGSHPWLWGNSVPRKVSLGFRLMILSSRLFQRWTESSYQLSPNARLTNHPFSRKGEIGFSSLCRASKLEEITNKGVVWDGWPMSVISALGRGRQESWRKVCLGFIVRSYLKNSQNQNHINKHGFIFFFLHDRVLFAYFRVIQAILLVLCLTMVPATVRAHLLL